MEQKKITKNKRAKLLNSLVDTKDYINNPVNNKIIDLIDRNNQTISSFLINNSLKLKLNTEITLIKKVISDVFTAPMILLSLQEFSKISSGSYQSYSLLPLGIYLVQPIESPKFPKGSVFQIFTKHQDLIDSPKLDYLIQDGMVNFVESLAKNNLKLKKLLTKSC